MRKRLYVTPRQQSWRYASELRLSTDTNTIHRIELNRHFHTYTSITSSQAITSTPTQQFTTQMDELIRQKFADLEAKVEAKLGAIEQRMVQSDTDATDRIEELDRASLSDLKLTLESAEKIASSQREIAELKSKFTRLEEKLADSQRENAELESRLSSIANLFHPRLSVPRGLYVAPFTSREKRTDIFLSDLSQIHAWACRQSLLTLRLHLWVRWRREVGHQRL